ncbi:hypothetical protein JCM10213_003568, partial [Rhodosporidiobolus nylandii]
MNDSQRSPPAPQPSSSAASPPSAASPSSASSAVQGIAHATRELVSGWPVASQLQGVGDVVHHLPSPSPLPPSFFPAPGSFSLQAAATGILPAEPLFDQYSREIAALIGEQNVEGMRREEVDRYRADEARRLAGAGIVKNEVQRARQGRQNYGSLPPMIPPYPFATLGELPGLQPNSSFDSQFLHQSAFSAPPVPSTFSVPSAFPPLTSPAPAPSAAVSAFIDEQLGRAQAAAAAAQSAAMQRSTSSGSRGGSGSQPQTPSTSQGGGPGRIFTLPGLPPQPEYHPPAVQPPTSSPDPLSLQPYSATISGPSRPRITAVTGGMRYSTDRSPQAVPGGAHGGPVPSPLGRKRSQADMAGGMGSLSPPTAKHAFELVVPSPARRRTSGDKRKGTALAPSHPLSSNGMATPRSSQPHTQADQLGPAFTLTGQGVDTGMKRFKLDSLAPVTPGTGMSGGGKASVVEKLDDLLSDVFGADDAFVSDTSSAAVGGAGIHRSPSRRAGTSHSHEQQFFRTTAVAPSSSFPLLHTATLQKLLKLFRAVTAKGKAEELLEAVEEGGIGRLLKLLERSWDGMESGWEGWEKEAGEAREEVATALEDQGGKGKGKKKASPAKGRRASAGGGAKGKGGKKRKVAETVMDVEDDYEEEEDELASSPAKKGSRRSSRTPSPSRSPPTQLPPSSPHTSQQDGYWTTQRLSTASAALRNLHDALLASRLALEVLALPLPPAHPLPKHLFSSDYLSALISTIRSSALDACFFPLLEAPASSALAELVGGGAGGAELRERIAEVVESTQQAVELLARLVRREELGEDLVISLSYLAVEPFFHDAPLLPTAKARSAATTEGPVAAAHKGLRMAALELLKAVYGRYPEQRMWVLEEVLGNLGKGDVTAAGKSAKGRGAIRLRTNASIQTTSALLLHLVQTPPFELHTSVRRRLAQAEQAAAKAIDQNGDSQMELAEELGLGKRLGQEDGEEEKEEEKENEGDVLASISRRLLDPAAESAQKAARTVVGFLLQRAAKAGKTASGTADSEYRAVLDHLISDLLAVLHLPEWPGADVLLGVLCRSMMATLADPKSTHEGNSLKGIALEYLGPIAARIRQDVGAAAGELSGWREAVASADVDNLEKTFAAQKSVIEHLERAERSSGTGGEGVATFSRLNLARDLLAALEQAKVALAELSPAELDSDEGKAAQALADRLELLAKAVWEEGESEDVFGPSPEDAQPRIDAATLDVWRTSSLAAMYNPLLDRIVEANESAQVTLRTKALRAVSLVVAQDPELFHQANIRKSIENRMLDASPAVRDAVIELVGKYVVGRPDLAQQYLPRLMERISDTGLSVRRRVVKLLKALYHVVEDEALRIEICRKLVYRALDEDDGIKDLAVEAVEDLWFGPPPKSVGKQATGDITSLTSVIVQTTGVFRERGPPVDEALRLIMAKHVEKGTAAPLGRVKEVVEALIDGLVEDDREMDLVAGIKTVYVLSAVDPSLLSTAKATLLLPFLKSATSVEEQAISDCLLKIFSAAVAAQPKTASKFGKDLQAALVPMLNKPSQNVNTLQEVIVCFCGVIHHQTQDYAMMIRIFAVTLTRLNSEAQRLLQPETAKNVKLAQLPVLCYMTALLCEHGHFDRIREENPAAKEQIDKITTASIAESTYNHLVRLHSMPQLPHPVKATVLSSLGFLYRAHPTLMLNDASTGIIDAIFASPNAAMHQQVLRIVQEFLASQERASIATAVVPAKKKKAEQGVKMEELVGNVEGFADSGVASAISQRYLHRIINSALSPNLNLQRLGADLVSTIARSGFSHPLTLAATLVALTASVDPQVAGKAYSSLALIHQKHASLLATRFLEPARATHAYVKAMAGEEPVRGFRGDPPDSLLGRWF